MILKKILSFFLILFNILISVEIANSIEPNIFIQSTVNRASEALRSNFSKEQKIENLKSIAKDTVAVSYTHLTLPTKRIV